MHRLIVLIVLFSLSFNFHAAVWSASLHTPELPTASLSEQVIRLEQNPQIQDLTEPYQVAVTGFGGLQIQPWFWLYSIPVIGLGQFLMGDVARGLLFFLAPLAALAISLLIYFGPGIAQNAFHVASSDSLDPNFKVSALAFGGPILLFFILPPLLGLGLWIWNIVDAYQMNQDLLAVPPQRLAQKQAELQSQLEALYRISQENQLIDSHGLIGLNHRLATF